MREAEPQHGTWRYLALLGVSRLPALTSPFDPGYDPVTVEAHLEQSAHLMASLKLSMACWMIENIRAMRVTTLQPLGTVAHISIRTVPSSRTMA